MGQRHWIRDESGWIVPKEGTISRQVYDLLKAGKSWTEIIKAFPSSNPGTIAGKITNIKKPDARNAKQNARRPRKAPRVIVNPSFRRRAHRVAKQYGLRVAFDWDGRLKVISFPESVCL
jgi:hypothetical protein